ncbi:MAG: hypothetical protein ACOCSN_07000, partial [Halanaeroarchaeum sp.]
YTEGMDVEPENEDLDEFRDGYEKVYGADAWDPEKEVAVVEFEYVGRERPDRTEQTSLSPDGGWTVQQNGGGAE